jgi:hypothetical protein
MFVAMTESRHPFGSDPDVEVADEAANASSPGTVHFDARPVRAARCIEQEVESVVIRQACPAPLDPADVTLTVRDRARSRSALSRFVAWLEARWVLLIVALALPIALLLGVKLWH